MADLKKAKVRKTGSPKSRLRKPELVLECPADKSLAAFKRWINEMATALGAGESEMTEKEWRESWKKFWSD